MKILITEGDSSLTDSLRTFLKNQGFDIRIVYKGENSSLYPGQTTCDLTVLDVTLPAVGRYCDSSRSGLLSFGNTDLNPSTTTLICGSQKVRLSAREFDIMRLLMQYGERNISKETLLTRVWGYDFNAVENHVEVYIGFLRKKLKNIHSNIRIEAVRRIGYHLETADM